jgi:hypothetical protein
VIKVESWVPFLDAYNLQTYIGLTEQV